MDRFALRIKHALLQGNVDVGCHLPFDYTLGEQLSSSGFRYAPSPLRASPRIGSKRLNYLKEASCLSISVIESSNICRCLEFDEACSCCRRRSRERRSPSRSRFRFCWMGGIGAFRGFVFSSISSCCCSMDLLSQPRAILGILPFLIPITFWKDLAYDCRQAYKRAVADVDSS